MLGRSAQPFFSFNGPLQSFMEIDVGPEQEFWDGQFFNTKSVFVYAQMRPAAGVSAYFQGRYGEQVDYANSQVGDEQRIQPQLEWNDDAERRLVLTSEPQHHVGDPGDRAAHRRGNRLRQDVAVPDVGELV